MSSSTPFDWASLAIDSNRCLRAAKARHFRAGGDIGIAEATVKVHRSRLMQKMNARSLPALSRMADKLKLAPEEPQQF